MAENIKDIPMADAMMEGAARYARYVIFNRQFADLRDGLLPVQRFAIWATHQLSHLPKRDYVKCARIVGDIIGRYHPHGDQSAYGALCGLTRKHTVLAPIEGEGNFGSLIDRAAGYRYTDARLSDYGLMFVDAQYLDTVPYVSNYDGKEIIPVYLPALLPNILLNGAFGIGYGYMSAIPAFTQDSVAKLIAKAFLEDVTLKQCLTLEPCFVNNARYVDNGALKTFFETGEATMRVEPKVEICGKDIHVVGVYTINLLGFAEKLNLHPDVRSVSDSSNGDDPKIPVRVLVQCSRNVEEVKTIVIRELSASKPLRANLLTNNILPDFEHDNETLPSKLSIYPMPTLIKKWIDYRVAIEEKMLRKAFADHDKKLYRIEALISAEGHLKELASLLDEKLPYAELKERVSRLLHCDSQQAIIVLDTAIRRLAAMEVLQLKKEREDHFDAQDKIKAKIKVIYKTTANSVAQSFSHLE